jgi:ketosteroid isomerase-like protein
MSEATTIIRRYIELVGAHDLGPLDELFADDLVATLAGATFGKTEWIAALEHLLPIVVRNDIREVFDGEATAAVFYDFVITVRDGAITTVELIFEKAKWGLVMAELQARAGK